MLRELVYTVNTTPPYPLLEKAFFYSYYFDNNSQ